MTKLTAINYAVEVAGGQAKLAKAIGMAPAFMNQVCQGKRALPARYCLLVENKTGVSRKDLTDEWHLYWPELD